MEGIRLKDKVALISGGARGMGAVEAQLFAKEGAKVVIGDILDSEGAQVAAEISEAGLDAMYVHLDVTVEEDWRQAIDATVIKFGKLNVLVNNAGIGQQVSLEEISGELWDYVMAVNTKGVFLGTKHAIPVMRKAGGGSIINISSMAGLVGGSASAVYHASKGAVRLLTKSAAIQYGREGIRVNSVHPGVIETPMTEAFLAIPSHRQDRIEKTPMRRIGTSEDVAYGVLFLASDESSFVTGSELVIDGGRTAQ